MKIAIIGSGFIGQSWAIVFARAGCEVALHDADPAAIGRAQGYIAAMLPELAAEGLLHGAAPQAVARRIRAAESLADALDGVAHVQENTPERIEVKRAVFAELDRLAPPGAVLASSTSALLPSAFTAGLPGAARCVVAHPVNPPHLIPAVEIVPAPHTAAETVARTAALMTEVGQSAVVLQREIDGFLVNRLQGALLHEAFRLLSEGYAGTEEIDICIRDGLGPRWSFMGPFETIDLNAPGGIGDYISRYGPFYAGLWPGAIPIPDWAAAGPAAEAGRRARLALDDMAERRLWRDRRLMALAGRATSGTI